MKKKWIKGYEGKYYATTDGHIYRVFKSGGVRQIKGYVVGNMYRVKLTNENGTSKEFTFNRLIWETFKGEIPEGYLVVRKTRILTKNELGNLKLKTKSEHGVKTGPTSRSKEVVLLDENGEIINSWPSARKAAKDLYVSYQTVMNICNKKIKREPAVNVRWAKGRDLEHPRLPGEFIKI